MPQPLIPPQDCEDMQSLRAQIDLLDDELIELLARRAGYIDRAIALKTNTGWPARIPERVEQVLSHVRDQAATKGLAPDLAEALWRELIEWSIAREEAVLGQG